VRDTLSFGDYSIRGFEQRIAVERKNLDDLWSSLTTQRDRFGRELEQLCNYDIKYILVEGSEVDALTPHLSGRQVHPNSVRQAIASIEGKLGIPFHYAAIRSDAERWLLDTFIKYYHLKRDTTEGKP
jgi:ERCC4-type nuclease